MSRIVVVGVGGLGCPAALALAESGAPLELVLVDDDRVERSNLARQVLFQEQDVGEPKAAAAAGRLRALGSLPPSSRRAQVEFQNIRFSGSTAAALLRGADVLLDASDNFETRFVANDACVAAGVPLVHGAALGWEGRLLTILPGRTACLRCLFEGPPTGPVPTCAEAGVASPLCGLVGAAMARAALKILAGTPEAGVLRRWATRTGAERPLSLRRDPSCACGILPPCPSP